MAFCLRYNSVRLLPISFEFESAMSLHEVCAVCATVFYLFGLKSRMTVSKKS